MMQEVVEMIKNMIRTESEQMHTAVPARVESVNPDGTVNARPYGVYRMPSGEVMDYPLISAVPVYMFKSGIVSITVPLGVGDGCILIFADNELDAWLYGQQSGVTLSHSMSNAIALPGLGKPAAADGQAGGAVIVRNGSTEIRITAGGVTVSGNLTVSGNIAAGGSISPNPPDE